MRTSNWILVALLVSPLAGCSNPIDPAGSEASALFASPAPAAGEALPTAARRWTYTALPDAFCRDGSTTGVAINARPDSDALMIYLEQGGACFNAESCALNPANATVDFLAMALGLLGTDGLFNRAHRDNPVRDWNIVYVPYCTGDLHLGARPDGNVPGAGPQKFVGYTNIQKFLPRIAATFPNVRTVLLTGASAGGVGTLAHAAHVRAAFPEARLRVLEDSGPTLSGELLAECFQDKMSALWGLPQTWLEDCGGDCPDAGDSFQDYPVHVARSLPGVPFGILASAGDTALRTFPAGGRADCSGQSSLLAPSASASQLTADLLRLRERLEPFDNASTFFADSEQHTWTAMPGLFSAQAGGKRMVDWVKALIEGDSPGHFGP